MISKHKNKRLFIILAIALGTLFIPFIAMKFTNEVNWSLFDYIIIGILLLVLGLMLEFILRITKNIKTRVLYIFILTLTFFIIWAELAVGIFGSPFAGN